MQVTRTSNRKLTSQAQEFSTEAHPATLSMPTYLSCAQKVFETFSEKRAQFSTEKTLPTTSTIQNKRKTKSSKSI
eukprot:170846-Amphidinium_carterae.1